jgi:YD repeat-containing protein
MITLTTAFDAFGRPVSLTEGAGAILGNGVQYNEAEQMTAATFPGGSRKFTTASPT